MTGETISEAGRLAQFLAHFDRYGSAVSITTIRVLLAVARGADSAAAVTRQLAEDGAPVPRRTVHQQLNALQGRGNTVNGKPSTTPWCLVRSRPHPHHKQALQLQLSANGAALVHAFYPSQNPPPAR
jgi:hypothetical protein